MEKKTHVFENNAIHVGLGYEIDVDKAVNLTLNLLDVIDDVKMKVKEYALNILSKEFRWDVIAKKLIEVVSQ